jgi:phosphoribosylformimino-5-aminoimidazole carboxamide ribotide isomerase
MTRSRWPDTGSQGARRLHLVDLNGAFAGTPVNGGVVQAIARHPVSADLQIGGGIRDLGTIARYLGRVSWVIIGTKAVRDPVSWLKPVTSSRPDHRRAGCQGRHGGYRRLGECRQT